MGRLRDSLFVLHSGWSSVFPLSCSRFVLFARSFALCSPSFPMVPVSPRFSFPLRFVFHPLFFPSFFPMVSVFSLIPFKALLFFVFVPFFRLFALGSASFPFPFSLIRLALPFISFVVFGFLSASLHRDAPSGGGVGRAAWPRMGASAVRRESLIHVSIEHRVDAIASHVGEDPVRVPVRREPDGVPDAPRGLRVDAIVVAGDDAIEDPAARVDRKMKTCPALQRWGLARDA